jgi:superfamily II RNA helicase
LTHTPSTYTVEEFQLQQDFPLDDFQVQAAQALSEGSSVVVCAPTGSGKTIVAEFAAMSAIALGKKLFYTTPLKALSNQKFYDLRKSLGEANVGLLTGDISINRDARVVVMTTEIFRNLLYGGRDDSTLLDSLGYVVLDECHYMNDAERGTVWEESIIYCPESVQIVALSATVANAAELTDWINEVHHNTVLVWSDFRPVPLRFSYYNREHLLPLFEAPGVLNRKLKHERKGDRMGRKQRIFQPGDLIKIMHEKDMLPAIFFTFSRKDCDQYLENTHRLSLLNPTERRELERQVDEYLVQNDFLANNPQMALIRNGFASHHAGLLPGVKHLVETLFQQGLIKVVFATETLAAGINMPARSTVITKISKRTNDGHRMLTASEFLQMSGRAGRRGMDAVGYVLVVSSQYEGAQEAATLASSPADALNSRFTPNYGMVLNLLRRHNLEQAEFLVRQSFAEFTSARRLRPLVEEQQAVAIEVGELKAFACPYGVSDKDFHNFERNQLMRNETARFVGILRKQLQQHGDSPDLQQQLTHEQAKMRNLRASIAELPCEKCDLLKKHRRVDERLEHGEKKLKALDRQLIEAQDTDWKRFTNIQQLLRETHYLDEENRPNEKGAITVQIRTENEYAMTEVLTSGLLEGLTPPQMAALMCALINDSTRENQFVKLPLSPEVLSAGRDIEKLYMRLDRLQRKYNVSVPMSLNSVASGLAEAWAHGVSWERLIRATNIGEGDIVRLFRRTADILRQVSRTEGVSKGIRESAREALRAIYREPIKEITLPEANEIDIEPPIPQAAGLEHTAAPGETEDVERTTTATAAEPIDQTINLSSQTYQHPDWKPLGTVRDYFNEQMRQDFNP